MNKIIKIAGMWVAAEIIFAAGKGHMLSCVRRIEPEAGEHIRECVDAGVNSVAHKYNFRRALGVVICKVDDFATELYSKEDGKRG